MGCNLWAVKLEQNLPVQNPWFINLRLESSKYGNKA